MISRVNPAPNQIQSLTLEGNGKLLRVHRDGMYKVSLQITYTGTEKWKNTTNGSYILQHNIKYHTDSYGIEALPLLTYIETVTFTSPYWSKSMFSEGIFFLQFGDRLEVGTNSLLLIDGNVEQKTVFVVYPHFSTWREYGENENKNDILSVALHTDRKGYHEWCIIFICLCHLNQFFFCQQNNLDFRYIWDIINSKAMYRTKNTVEQWLCHMLIPGYFEIYFGTEIISF